MADDDKEEVPSDASRTAGAPGGRTRWRVSPQESKVLECVFKLTPRPNKATIQQLALALNVKQRQVQVWFQNRRQRWRKDFAEQNRDAATTTDAPPGTKVLDYLAPSTSAPTSPSQGTPVAAEVAAAMDPWASLANFEHLVDCGITVPPTAVDHATQDDGVDELLPAVDGDKFLDNILNFPIDMSS